MPARELLAIESKSLAGDSPLKVDREQPVLSAAQHCGRQLWPGSKRPRLAEHRRPFGDGPAICQWPRTAIGLHDLNEIRREVVEEQRVQICDIRLRTSVSLCAGLCGFSPADGIPPLASCLARERNHRADQHDALHRNVRRGQWRTEPAQRLRDQDHRFARRPSASHDQIAVLERRRSPRTLLPFVQRGYEIGDAVHDRSIRRSRRRCPANRVIRAVVAWAECRRIA